MLEKQSKGIQETYDSTLNAIKNIPEILDENFENVVNELYNIKGKIIITGMGKSGIVGKKIAATLASTGSSSFFIHPGEAYHGDLGMFGPDDIVIAISHSGNTGEVTNILPVLQKHIGVKVVGLTGNKNSQLAKQSDYNIIYKIENEGYLNLPPMASTTTQIVIGDLIATALMEKRNFQDKNFAVFHPGGSLGKKLLLTMENILKKNGDLLEKLTLGEESSLQDAIIALSEGRMGGIIIVDKENKLLGVFTDGDLRKHLNKNSNYNFNDIIIKDVMTINPKYATLNQKPIDVLNMMENYNIFFLPILNSNKELSGVINIHDLLKEGIK